MTDADVIVIGGGAAGMMASYFAASEGASVLLLDKNRQLGRKLRITGKGRCNLTSNCDRREFLENISGDSRFLYSAVSSFLPQDVMAFFEEHRVPLKTERGKRVFPQSDNANDIADCLASLCRSSGVRVMRTAAAGISLSDGEVVGVKTENGVLSCRACIVCTGGLSYPLTGSDGDGYRFAKAFGHTVSPLRPSLVPLQCAEPYCAQLQGLSLKNVELRLYEDGRLLSRELGEMLFTHFGVSGPLVLSASARMRQIGAVPYRLEIDLKPALDEKTLDQRILRDLQKYQNRELRNALTELMPHALIPVILELAEADGFQKANALTRETRHRILHTLKAFPLTVTGTGSYEEAIVTAGGVSTREVNPRSMESRLIPGLYFAGEVLDLDGYTGGFNLQIAWSTGRLAGLSAAKRCLTDSEKNDDE